MLQAFALLQMASLIYFLAFGRSIPLWLPGYLLLTVALHAGLWRWLGGRQGLLGIIRTYGRQRKIAFKVSVERYVFIFWMLSMLVPGAGCACLYIESELARDGTRHFAGSGQ